MRSLSRVVQEDGWRRTISRGIERIYERVIRPAVPIASPVYYAGIPIGSDRKYFDQYFPRLAAKTRNAPDYERALVSGLHRQLRDGERVVVVGGGWGVTAAVAAMGAGPTGHVTCFEGSAQGVERVRSTLARNGVAERVTLRHAIVADGSHVYGDSERGELVAPVDLPGCDVLQLDCEGAELAIIKEMTIQPRVVLVETHGCYGAPSAAVADALTARGYSVENIGPADPSRAAHCLAEDIVVLVALKQPEDRR